MQFTLRLAPQPSARFFPLPINDEAAWSPCEGEGFEAVVALPDVPAGHIIVPSFCLVGTRYRYTFSLLAHGSQVDLHPVPNKSDYTQQKLENPPASPKIDCWHTERDLQNAAIHLKVHAAAPPPSLHHLICVSLRPVNLDVTALDNPQVSPRTEVSRLYCQMQADPNIRHRICSPTALAMCLSDQNPAPSWQDTIEACFDPYTKAYGAWPRAIYWAGQQGRLAAVEVFSGWRQAVDLLDGGHPLVCSVRWDRGALDGAPMDASGGHLVLLRGVDHKNRRALVLEPAAAELSEVEREYGLEQFSEAWLARRGAAYVIGDPVSC